MPAPHDAGAVHPPIRPSHPILPVRPSVSPPARPPARPMSLRAREPVCLFAPHPPPGISRYLVDIEYIMYTKWATTTTTIYYHYYLSRVSRVSVSRIHK